MQLHSIPKHSSPEKRKNIEAGREQHQWKEGHCRYLALTNDLIYDRFIKHQNYVNKPLKTINCCKNCASKSTHTSTPEHSILAKCNAPLEHHPSLSTTEKKPDFEKVFYTSAVSQKATIQPTYHGWIDVK